ncbi:C25 family cysteine peptidase [Candidatus Eisenbacteria bacterium]|uniref:C25 family cysteine peptidase n=1 Tax=Eiseniibacteriota bacterium TaxID=2212470 RepID=A0ABV6YNE7_UNCEI
MGSGKTSLWVCLICICTLFLSWFGASTALAADGYRLISEGERTLTFTVDLPSYDLDEFTYEGEVYSSLFVTGYAPFSPEGSPDLPVFTILVAVPPGGDASIASFSRSDERVIENVKIAPVPVILAMGEGPYKSAYYEFGEGPAYEATAPYPEVPVWIDQKGRMRHQDVVRVYVSPFIYEPGRKRLLAAGRTTVTVAIEGQTTLRGSMGPDDAWEGLYGNTLLNYERGRAWRAGRMPARTPALKSQALTNDRVKFLIDQTGMFAVTFDALSTAGFPGGISIDDLFMYTEEFAAGGPDLPDTMKLDEVAIRVTDSDSDGILSGGDEIVFYGQNFYDQFGWKGGEDYFFDENVYWLSWDDGEHARMTSRTGWPDVSAPSTPAHFEDFVHMEKDSMFINFPPSGAPIDFYTWRPYSQNVQFGLPGLEDSQPVTLEAKFISYYFEPYRKPTVATIDILVNGCDNPQADLAAFSVSVPSVYQSTFPVEAGVFCEEGNIFRFQSRLEAVETPGNILDWLEAVYRRRYEALDDVLIFTSGGLTGELEFEVEGFSDTNILLFDVTDSLSPVVLDVPPERIIPGAEGYTLTFQDNVVSEHTYIALCAPEMGRVGPEQLTFLAPPSLRDASADYLVVSHPDFVDDLDALMDHRRAQGYSVLKATTDQVYDDFGNGMKSDIAIKSFIRNAYLIGGTQFVLLVGDGSTDRRGLLLDPPMGNNASDVDYLPGHNIFVSDGHPPNREIRPYEYWFVTLEGDDDPYPDLYIGRLPVGSAAEVEGAVAKILNSENDSGDDPWKKRMLLVADDQYNESCPSGSDTSFEEACDSAAVIATDFAVVAPETTKYYLERCTRFDQTSAREANLCTSPLTTRLYTRSNCTPALRSLLNAGSFLVNYQGHANRDIFTFEGLILDSNSYADIRNLTNFEKPFVFLGFGCWISDFQSVAEGIYGDAIGERFVLNPFGAGSASFASGCAEYISTNKRFNPFVIRAIYTHLQGMDVAGNPQPARVLLGEAVTTALIRFAPGPYGSATHIQKHVLLGDPAMVMDMGPPLLEATANDLTVDDTYVFTGGASDTLHIVSLVKDEEAIMELGVSIAEGGLLTPVDPSSYQTQPLIDTEFTRSRSYDLTYDHVPHLGNYSIRIGAEDYAGKTSSLDVNVSTGSAEFFANSDPLEEGGLLVIGQSIRILLGRADPFGEADIKVVVDTIPAEDFADYSVEMKDAEGKQWEVSFAPSLSAGNHTVEASIQGLASRRGFAYVPARIDYYVGYNRLLDNDYVSGTASYRVIVTAEAGITEDDISMELNGEPLAAAFEPDSSGTAFEATFDLELDTGDYELATVIFDSRVPVTFVVSDVLQLLDVSVYPSPFPRETFFYYTLSQDALDVRLEIYTVSGRKIFDAALATAAGYNEYRWDGRDVAGDRIANGTYLYKIVAGTSSREKEFTGWVVKVE